MALRWEASGKELNRCQVSLEVQEQTGHLRAGKGFPEGEKKVRL